ncbi:MAG: insulinase family protein [Vicinamibacterales bacterium]
MIDRARTPVAVLLSAVIAGATLVAHGRPDQAATRPDQAAAGQQVYVAGARTAPLTTTVPVDPDIATGRFDNGLRYYIRANRRPEQRAELRLAVNVGSIVEADDQRGLAHFVEHMAFNGTKHFPKQDIVSFMESIGMQFGPSVNAYTSFDETVYMLEVPTDRPEVLDRAMLILEDWAHDVSFDDAEIDKERGVVIEEWRLGRGADARMRDQQFPTLLKDSRYAERLPIGTKDILETFPHDRLRQFYRDWYRPDLMAVVAVGDFDVAAVRGLVEQHFGSLPMPASPKPRPEAEVPDQPGTLFAVATDPEAAGASVQVYSKMALRDPTSIGAYRQSLVEGLFGGMLSARFGELSRKPDAPFLGASAGRGLFVRTKEASTLGAIVRPEDIGRGLEALFVEAERVARFGFTAAELDRAKTNILRSFERAVTEKANRQSAALADEYLRHFTQREPIPGIDYEYALAQRFVPAITLADVNGLAREWAPEGNRVVLVSAPAKPGITVPTEAELAKLMADAADKELTPWVDSATNLPLLDPVPAAGTIVARRAMPALGLTEWTLSNGATVYLMPTDIKQDEVVLRAFSPGGTSLASDADFVPAATATQVVGASGFGAFNGIDLGKALAGKVAAVQPFIDETSEGVSGSASTKDLETFFQLLYLKFTQPRADAEIFGVMTSQAKAALANQGAQPGFAFQEALTGALSQNHPRARLLTAAMVDEMDLQRSVAFYKDRFSDASDFTFVFVGTFTPDQIEPLVTRYLASLPATHRDETWRDVGIHAPEGVVTRRVEKGVEPQSRTSIVFTGPFAYTQENRVAIRAMALVLQTRLRERLREDLGGTYSVGVNASYERIPRQEYAVSIGFGSGPERTDALADTVFEQIKAFQADGPTPAELATVRETLMRELETSMQSNGYLVAQLAYRIESGEPVEGLLKVGDYYQALTAAAIRQAAVDYLNADRYVRVSLFPEKR